MALDIRFYDRSEESLDSVAKFEVREDPDRPEDWIIPEVVLIQTDKRVPLLCEVEFKVEGDPQSARGRIEAAYSSRPFAPPEPIVGKKSLLGIKATDAGRLPGVISCDLKVTVKYQDSDQGERPGPLQTITRSCRLVRGEEKIVPVPVLIPSPPVLSVKPGVHANLFVEVVRGPSSGVAPRVRLAHPDTVFAFAEDDPIREAVKPHLSELRDALTQAFDVAPSGATRDEARETRIFQFPILMPGLTSGARTRLSVLKQPFEVPLVAELPGTKARPIAITGSLSIPEEEFPFWLVIDFGTTNSTVTAHSLYTTQDPHGLPDEQNESLRKNLGGWFDQPATEALPGGRGFEPEWARLTSGVAALLHQGGGGRLSDYLADRDDPTRLYKALTQIEISLRGHSEPFRRAAYSHLHEYYHKALRVPSLKRRSLFPVILDRLRKEKPIESFMEILEMELLASGENKIRIEMGPEAHANFLQAIASAPADADLDAIRSRFHPSPKRYFATKKVLDPVHLGEGSPHPITVDDLMKAGWNRLIELTEQARDKYREFPGKGRFRRAVITYPTAAPPAVRQKIKKLMAELQIHDVQTDYDEAVAAAIFYLMREYSGATEVGLESFKTRAREDKAGEWVQNVLVFDIGGGTTDVALIELKLVEPKVAGTDSGRGAGGRFYRFLPKLLSSTGHMQLGGELMTLRLFHLLKATLADRLLTLVQDNRIQSPAVKRLFETNLIPDDFRTGERYRPESLRKMFETSSWDLSSPEIGMARQFAEEVLPTRWEARDVADRSKRLQAFYLLWQMADLAKKEFSVRPAEGASGSNLVAGVSASAPPYLFPPAKVKQFITLCRPELAAIAAEQVRLEFPTEKLEQAIWKVVDDAVTIAKGTLDHLPPKHKVDWLILSGQSCNLALVDRTIRSQFEKSERFIWNPERVTFDQDFAKLATSLGACYAEEYRRRNFDPSAYSKALTRGESVIDYDIDNMFTNLPCNLHVAKAEGGEGPVLFKSGTELTEIEPAGRDDGLAKARTDWLPCAITMTVMRSDFKEEGESKRRQSVQWVNLDMSETIMKIDMDKQELQTKLRIQFEVDHRLDIVAYICRLDKGQRPQRQFADRMSPVQLKVPAPEPASTPTGAPGPQFPPPTPEGLWDEQGRLRFDIAVRLQNTLSMIPLFRAGTMRDTVFRIVMAQGSPVSKTQGLLSETTVEQLPTDMQNAVPYQVFMKPQKSPNWIPVAQIECPTSRPTFKRRCRFTLDASGILRIHEGEPAYYISTDPAVLKSKPGVVFRWKVEGGERDEDKNRNPFNGMH